MSWFETPVALDGPTAHAIAEGMRAVARADGDVHPRELELIAQFQADLPGDQDATGSLADPEVQSAYLRSLVMVALADGVITDAEDAEIRRLATAQGIDEDRVDAAVLEVKHQFLGVFSGVSVFRESVAAVARSLGLDPDSTAS